MKKSFALLAILVTVVSFAFAGGGGQRPQDGRINLSWFIPGTGEIPERTYQMILANVQRENPNIDAEKRFIPWGEYFTVLNVAFSGGTAPDLYGVGLGQIGPVQYAGNMLALNPFLADWDGWDDIPANVLNFATRDGRLYGNPMTELRVLYYRRDLFRQAGFTRPPQTIDELESYARRLTRNEGGRITMSGLSIGTGEQTLFTAMLMFGADKYWNEDLTSAMLEPRAMQALEWCRNIMVTGISDHTIMHNIEGGMFENGVAAMSLDGSAAITNMVNRLGRENVGVALLPTERYMAGSTCWSVFARTRHIEEAVTLWKALASREGQMIVAREIGFVPTRRSLRDEYIALDPEFNSVFFEAASRAAPYGVLNEFFFEFVNNIRPLIDEVYYQRRTSLDAMREFENRYHQAMRDAIATR